MTDAGVLATQFGTRVRAGNTMAATRAALLAAALGLVAERGTRRTSMSDIAAAAGVAKGTLYNHFRTKDDVFAAVLASEIRHLAAECAPFPLAEALTHAAGRLASHPALNRLAAEEPATLAGLLTAAPGRADAVAAVASALAAAGRDPGAADLVLRWLVSHIGGGPAEAGVTAGLLAEVLPEGASVDLR